MNKSPDCGPPGGDTLVDTASTRGGMTEIRFRTDHLELCVLPDAGGKILALVDRRSDFNLLWQNPRVPPARTYAGAPFDDVWCGGWDDVFPTDASCTIADCTYHDHGDLWIGPWDWVVENDDGEVATVHLSRVSSSLPCRIDKRITMWRGRREVRVRLELTNLGAHPVSFVWNQHIAHAIGKGSRVHLPAHQMAVAGTTGSRAGAVDQLTWPVTEDGLDLSHLPGPEAAVTEFLHPLDLREGWCVVTHPAHDVALRVRFDKDVFRTPWLWGVFGGWRGHHLLLTEPCTSRPGSLASAVEDGTAASLEAGRTLQTELRLTVATAFDRDAPGDQDPVSE